MSSTAPDRATRPRPRLHDRNRPYWTGGADGELRIQRCRHCERLVHPPALLCPYDQVPDLEWTVVSGRGVVETWTESSHSWVPAIAAPYVIALVDLDEDHGARILTNLVDISSAEIRVGMAVQVRFESVGEGDERVWLPLFGPVADAAAQTA